MDLRRSALGLAAGLSLAAGAAFAQPLNVSNSPGVPSGAPQIAVDSRGNAHAVWVELTGTNFLGRPCGDVYYAMGDAGALRLGIPVKISASGTTYSETEESVSIAVDGSDRIYVLWVEYGRILLRIKDGSAWGIPFLVESGKVYDAPRIAVTPDGDIFTIHWNYEGRLFSRARVGGVWEESRFIGNWSSRTKMPDIDVGTSVVGACFSERPGGPEDFYQIGYAQRSRAYNADWSGSMPVAPAGGMDQMHPALKLDASDIAHIIWMTPDEMDRVIQYSRKSGGGFTAAVDISPWGFYHFPFMAESHGSLYVVWQNGGYGGGTSVDYNIRGADGLWKGAASVPSSGGCTYVDMAASADGSILYWVWDTWYGQPDGEIFGWAQTFAPPNPSISLGASRLFFGAVQGGTAGPAQIVSVVHSGPPPRNWTVADNRSWITAAPASGSGSGQISVTVDPSGLGPGAYTGVITVADPNAAEFPPKTITVSLTVYPAGASSAPFGAFETPTGGATVRSSVPVTGWALDDIGVRSVKIYRDPVAGEPAGAAIFVGDAVMVEGARPDVAAAYPGHPLNRRAGWGYMLLTNFLPGGGNGSVTLWAVAQDFEGRTTALGSKAVFCDNANAVEPFGAIDTPAQGGTAFGNPYYNFGWALTPPPKSIPRDGSTIRVWLDGVPLGNPDYGHYRQDIATLFPGYANSTTGVGFYKLDTTRFADGLHSIAWSVIDSAGATAGIGSRYFQIMNAGGSASGAGPVMQGARLAGLPRDDGAPVYLRRGFDLGSPAGPVFSSPDGERKIEISELDRIAVYLDFEDAQEGEEGQLARAKVLAGAGPARTASRGRPPKHAAHLVEGGELRPLPVGSTFDPENGVFYWQPGPGFVGEYGLVILGQRDGLMRKIPLRVIIRPKY
ncbi:MAG: BACON domain-containing protein [Candidatus Aminicenantes bacterium]|nr:BACON domain-containing protein [Candidatus Aminicenantes bacterium]